MPEINCTWITCVYNEKRKCTTKKEVILESNEEEVDLLSCKTYKRREDQ